MSTKFNPETDILPLFEARALNNKRIENENKRRLAILAEARRKALNELNGFLLNGYAAASYYFKSSNCPGRENAISIANELKEQFVGAGYRVNIIEYPETNKRNFVSIDIFIP